jgi:hypothetical protein
MFPHQRCHLLLLALALGSSLPGCVPFRNWCGQRFSPAPPPCVLPDDATQAEVVNHLNENTKKIVSWRTTKATIEPRGAGILVRSVGAMIAVESPRNFRLIATNPMTGGNEVDLGSNSEHFWFWNRRNEDRCVYQARHDQLPGGLRRFPIPFQPDWIMESLGVIEINPEEQMTMQPGPAGSHTVLLVADRASPEGFKVRKVTVVDLCHGVIREHALWDARSQLIARAVLTNYVADPKAAGAVIARKIDLEWPQAKLGMTMTLADIEVNPDRIPPRTWKVPDDIPNNPVRDMN